MAAMRGSTGKGHVLSVTVLVGVLTLALGSVTAVALYVDRLSSAVAKVATGDPITDYPGRPEKVSIDGASPLDYLVWITDGEDELLAAEIVHLSASRTHLTLIEVPAGITTEPTGESLAVRFAAGQQPAAELVEGLLEVRIDHVASLDVARVGPVLDALDLDSGLAVGIQRAEASSQSAGASEVTTMVQAVMTRLAVPQAITNPSGFSQALAAIESCVTVDATLDSSQIESILVETKVRADEVGFVVLPTEPGSVVADPASVVAIRQAMATDSLASMELPGR